MLTLRKLIREEELLRQNIKEMDIVPRSDICIDSTIRRLRQFEKEIKKKLGKIPLNSNLYHNGFASAYREILGEK